MSLAFHTLMNVAADQSRINFYSIRLDGNNPAVKIALFALKHHGFPSDCSRKGTQLVRSLLGHMLRRRVTYALHLSNAMGHSKGLDWTNALLVLTSIRISPTVILSLPRPFGDMRGFTTSGC